jgi:hypothetical protein
MPDIVSKNQFGVPSARAPRKGEGPQVAARKSKGGDGGPGKAKPGADIVRRESTDWVENFLRWRWLLDSFEGGERYRTAVYGIDRRGLPNRNLIRHKREYPDPQENPNQLLGFGTVSVSTSGVGGAMGIGPLPGQLGADPGATAHDDDYEYRRARTVPLEFMREAIEIHLGKIYDQEIRREGPPELQSDPGADEAPWWDDVDGAGRSIDDWMREDVAPLLMSLGCLDVCFDRPALPEGQELRTRRDEIDAGQDRVIASIILPENMVWWREDYAGNYVECLVREYAAEEDDADAEEGPDDAGFPANDRFDRKARYRHWTTETVALYKSDGEEIESPRPHGYPFLPIRHLVDGRLHRTPHIGKPRYEFIAECQKEYYNRSSELVLNDTLQSSPLLCMPEDYLKPDNTIPTGPGYVLPMKKVGADGGYVTPAYISPPKDPSESIRKSLQDIIDLKDRNACLTKPAAGVTGTTGGTVSQSGYSKAIDEHAGAKKLGSIAKTLARVEREVAEFALACILRRQLTRRERKAISVTYPSRFQLKTADELLQHLSILVPLLSMQAQAQQPADAVPDDQAGGNPKQTVATGGPAAAPVPQTLTMLPTGQAEIWRQYFGSMLQGVRGGVHGAIDKELMALYALHVLPDVGYESDEEVAIGRGSAEQAATIDRRGVSGVTALGGVPSMGI